VIAPRLTGSAAGAPGPVRARPSGAEPPGAGDARGGGRRPEPAGVAGQLRARHRCLRQAGRCAAAGLPEPGSAGDQPRTVGHRRESVYRVPPLGVPAEGADPDAIWPSEAVRLLADRAAAQGVPLAWDGPAAEVAGRICRRLDGIPLAVELAPGQRPPQAEALLARRGRGLGCARRAGVSLARSGHLRRPRETGPAGRSGSAADRALNAYHSRAVPPSAAGYPMAARRASTRVETAKSP
jgi:hypothetical protein